ncbi:hypothetical protein C8J56DRAFT_1113373 [Mycena floridula]|nr:hypothetical protein C8J56DRAFT_1113373 [Mycena floridula]
MSKEAVVDVRYITIEAPKGLFYPPHYNIHFQLRGECHPSLTLFLSLPMFESSVFLSVLAGVAWILIVKATKVHLASRQLTTIPTVPESAGIITSWYGAFRAITDAHNMVSEGYRKYHGRVFKIPTIIGWKIIISGPKLIEELRLAKDDQLSFQAAVAEMLQIIYTLGPEITQDPYHVETIRGPLTRNLVTCFLDTREEMVMAFASQIPPRKGAHILIRTSVHLVVHRMDQVSSLSGIILVPRDKHPGEERTVKIILP